MRNRRSRQNLEGWSGENCSSAAAPEAHTSTATAPTETTGATAATVTCHRPWVGRVLCATGEHGAYAFSAQRLRENADAGGLMAYASDLK